MRAALRLDRCDELVERLVRVDDAVVGRAVVVLHLLAADDVGRLEVVHEDRGQPVELRLRVGRVEVLEVEGADRDLVQAGGRRALGGDAVVDRADRVRHLEEEVAEVVVQHADERPVVVVADVHHRQRHEGVVRDDPAPVLADVSFCTPFGSRLVGAERASALVEGMVEGASSAGLPCQPVLSWESAHSNFSTMIGRSRTRVPVAW